MKACWITIAAVVMLSAAPSAQWINYPTPGIPRTADGKPNLSAPAPKTADGKPDISGLWLTRGIYIGNIAKDLKPGEVPFQPWAEALYKHRQETQSKDDPTGRCIPGGVPRSTAVPYPFKILHDHPASRRRSTRPSMRIARSSPTAGPCPRIPTRNWLGYSIGRWDGDTFVVESAGFNDNVWLDNGGHPATENLRVTERFRRKDFGNMDVAGDDRRSEGLHQTVDGDDAARAAGRHARSWNTSVPENEKDYDRLVGQAPGK